METSMEYLVGCGQVFADAMTKLAQAANATAREYRRLIGAWRAMKRRAGRGSRGARKHARALKAGARRRTA